jgi:pimeloyl-ACP methyl ester carboxylesterase
MGAFVSPLVARGLSVVTFDVPGHGDAPAGLASVVEHARAVAAAAATLGPIHAIIGHSVGGAASLFATRLGLLTERLALIAPPTSPARFAEGFAETMHLGPDVLRATLARLERRYGLSMSDLAILPDAARFPRPLLVVHDAEDRVVSHDAGASIAEAAPRGRLITTSGLGHTRILRAAEVVAQVASFVTDDEAAASDLAVSPLANAVEAELFYRDRRWGADASAGRSGVAARRGHT